MQTDKPLTIAAAVVLSCIGIFGIFSGPILQNVLQTGLLLDAEQSALIVGAEIGGAALASLLAPAWITRVNWRTAALLAVVILVAANVLTAYQSSANGLLALRFCAGLLGEGTAYAVAVAVIANCTTNHDRNFGFAVSAQVGVGILMFLVLPSLAQNHGMQGVMLPLAGLTLLLLPLGLQVPGRAEPFAPETAGQVEETPAKETKSAFLAISALVIIFIWTTGLGGIWTFIISIGNAGGLSSAEAGTAIAISTGLAIIGALSATALAGRVGRLTPVSIAFIIQVASISMLTGELSFLRFAATAIVFQVFWNFTGPFLMGLVSSNDHTGRISVLMSAALTGGFSFGPIIAGKLMTGASLLPANYVGGGCIALALVLFVALELYQKARVRPAAR